MKINDNRVIKYDDNRIKDAKLCNSSFLKKSATNDVFTKNPFTLTKNIKDEEERKQKIEDYKLKKEKAIYAIEDLAFALNNDGVLPSSGEALETKDVESKIKKLSDAGVGSIQTITQQVITRAVQTLPEVPGIYQYISKKLSVKSGQQVYVPYIGKATGAKDLSSTGEYPQITVDRSEEVYTAVGKSGIRVVFPEETIKNSNFDIIRLYSRLAKDALARHKNQKAVNIALSRGEIVFDNIEPDKATFGSTSGRGLENQGAENGSLSLRDIIKTHMYAFNKGIELDTILLGPFGYQLFLYEPTLRMFLEANVGTGANALFSSPSGSASKPRAIPNQITSAGGNAMSNNVTPQMNKKLLNINYKIIVTPYMNTYMEDDTLKKKLKYSLNSVDQEYTNSDTGEPITCGEDIMTDMVMLDSNNSLLYLEEEKIKSAKIKEELIDVTHIKFRERYGFAPLSEGTGIMVFKNLTITDDTFDFRTGVRPTFSEAAEVLNDSVADTTTTTTT